VYGFLHILILLHVAILLDIACIAAVLALREGIRRLRAQRIGRQSVLVQSVSDLFPGPEDPADG